MTNPTLTPLAATVSLSYDDRAACYLAEPTATVDGACLYCEGATPVQAAANLKAALAERGYFIPGFRRTPGRA
ncbi:hypothetical protein [Deinococcus petrolearius]|uniref:Uncharacterized protein n=1 Tax=Deinococcus petrolearius TaxID=1751295 RepID=A0ABW1DQR2_9DEIO